MSKIQIIRICLNAATVFLGALTISDLVPREYAGMATSLSGATSLAMRAIEGELAKA